jgi:uncharacterized protein
LRRRLGIVPPVPDKGIAMTIATVSAIATVPTDSASKYIQQLCKHWSHNLQVEFTPENGTIIFPKDGRAGSFPGDAVVTFDAVEDGLQVRIDGSTAEQVEALKGVVASHLDRFAFREAPLTFDWQ